MRLLIEPYSGGKRDTAGALAAVRNNDIFASAGGGDQPDYPNVAVVLTAGESDDQHATMKEAKKLRAQGTSLFAIGIGSSINVEELNGIAGKLSSKTVFFARNFNALGTARESLNQALCNSNKLIIKYPIW